MPPPANPDYRAAYPITAKKVTFALDVQVADGGVMSAPESQRVRGFVREYLRRARTPIVINTPSPDAKGADNGVQALHRQLTANGILANWIAVKPAAGKDLPADRYILSYVGYAVQVPECGNWSGETGFNPTALPHGNYGCAYQRNIGLMLVDPGDLVAPKPEGTRTAAETDRIVGSFREGKPTDAETRQDAKKGTVSSVGTGQ